MDYSGTRGEKEGTNPGHLWSEEHAPSAAPDLQGVEGKNRMTSGFLGAQGALPRRSGDALWGLGAVGQRGGPCWVAAP